MSKLKGLLLTEGMHGMISQVEGLAKALDIDYIHQKVELNKFTKFLPPKITPVSNLFFKNFKIPEFDLIISCGRKSVIPSIYLKKNSKKKIINIHIQDPKVSLKNLLKVFLIKFFIYRLRILTSFFKNLFIVFAASLSELTSITSD